MILCSLLILNLAQVQTAFPDYYPVTSVSAPLAKITALKGMKPSFVGKSAAWFHPGYRQTHFEFKVNESDLDSIRKQLALEKFSNASLNSRVPMHFMRTIGNISQYVMVPLPTPTYSEMTRVGIVTVDESPADPTRLQSWPKPLLDSKRPLGDSEIYPFAFLKKFKLHSVHVKDKNFATVVLASPKSREELKKAFTSSLAGWQEFSGRRTIRFSPKGPLQPGPYQIDLEYLDFAKKTGTRISVVSRDLHLLSRR